MEQKPFDQHLANGTVSLGFTRRALIGRGGLLLAASSLPSLVRAAAAEAAGLAVAPHRRANLAALVEAMEVGGSPLIGTDTSGAAVSRMASTYVAAPSETRRAIDKCLDLLDADGSPGSFSRLPMGKRLSSLRRQLRSTQVPHGDSLPAGARVYQAMLLAAPHAAQNASAAPTPSVMLA